ncbi:uncharacterized protein [Branchiostoma lanceolatum]|uniref:uncharacterized protein n=1 Tax=Branchiostoma lanceolatum TaxID=7740 RepID=UPI0034567925
MATVEMATIVEESFGSGKDQESDMPDERDVRKGSIDDIVRKYSRIKTNNNEGTSPAVHELWSPPPNGQSEEQFSLNEESSSEPDSGHFENQTTDVMKEKEPVPNSSDGGNFTTNTDNEQNHGTTKQGEESSAPTLEPTAQSTEHERLENPGTNAMAGEEPQKTNPDNGENDGATIQTKENITQNFEPQHVKEDADTFTKQDGDRNLPDDKSNEVPSANRGGGPDSLPNGSVPTVTGKVDEDHETNVKQPIDSVHSSETPVVQTANLQGNSLGETSETNGSTAVEDHSSLPGRNNGQNHSQTAGTSTDISNNPQTGTMNMADDWASRLTVSNVVVTENTESDSDETDDRCSGYLRRALRVGAIAVVFLVVLCCSVACKLTLFYMEVKLYKILNKTDSNVALPNTTTTTPLSSTTAAVDPTSCKPEQQEAVTIVIWLSLILVIPYVITFLRCVWISLMNWNYEPNPSRRHIVLGTLLAVLEVLSLATLVLLALPASPSIGLIVVNLVFMNTVLTKSFISYTGDNDGNTSKVKSSSLFVLFLLLLGGLAITVIPDKHWSLELRVDSFYILGSLALLAVSWTPILHKLSVSKDNSVHPEDQERGSSSGSNKTQNNTACWKLGIITNLVKCLVWALCVFVFYPLARDQDPFCTNWYIPPVSINDSVFVSFLANGLFGVFGYAFAILALMMRMQTLGFLLPIFLSNTAVSLFLIICIQTPLCAHIQPVHELGVCRTDWAQWAQRDWQPFLACCLVFVFTLIGMAVQLYDVWRVETIVMEKESKLLWTPGYNSVLLDQWLLLTRRTDLPRQNEERTTPAGTETTRVFICTTMYHEIAKEMKQLMSSLWDIARTQTKKRMEETKVEFEAHIFFDDGYKNGQVQDFALQLLSIIDSMGGQGGPSLIESCEKWRTPYGLQLQWHLHSSEGAWNGGMNLTLHLKDNIKVKNKKRWSQIMYMSYVLDYVLGSQARGPTQVEALDRDTYILATDADVKFTPESAMALLDLARRDPTVGAVCGRTHPLGSGPMVWYQKFDYAVGHWYQKTANSVLGSVLCCPGCFSVYRAEALREALGTYAGGVSEAREFLMKDMGEDRWLCTLMVSNGWRLEYTAVSEDSTYCPEEFAEFYNQRRRWGPSTVANQVELLEKYFGNEMRRDSVSFLFMVYQGLLFFSGLIGPATCILIIAGGMQFFNYHNGSASAQAVSITTVVVLSLVSLLYGMICLCTSQKFQLRMAMFLSLCFAVLMTLVLVSLIEDTVVQFRCMIEGSNVSSSCIAGESGESYTPSISTLYFLALVGMYVITGLVHFTEFPNLLYGVVYFLSLPTGYILLTLYSVCNLTDRTWGTREGNLPGQSADRSLTETISDFFATICGCCQRPNPGLQEVPLQEYEEEWDSDSEDEAMDTMTTIEGEPETPRTRRRSTYAGHRVSVVSNKRSVISMAPEMARPIPIIRWLRKELREKIYLTYADKFLKEGYEDSSFIAGMTNEDLVNIGIDTDFHREKLLTEIHKLTEFELETSVPNNVAEWLKKLRLEQYTQQFKDYGVNTKADLACLRKTDLTKLMADLNITKQGHIKRIKAAIGAMTEPDELQKEKYRVKRILMRRGLKIRDLEEKDDSGEEEVQFWEALREKKLNPDLGMFTSDVDLKAKLVGLRNSALVVLLVVNVLWITIMMVLSSRPALQVLGQNPMGFLSLAVFGLVQVIQFLAMLYHRLLTLLHAVARV